MVCSVGTLESPTCSILKSDWWFLECVIYYPVSQESQWNTCVDMWTQRIIDAYHRPLLAHCFFFFFALLSLTLAFLSQYCVSLLVVLYSWLDSKWVFKYNNSLTTWLISSLTSKWPISERACQKECDNWCWILIKYTICSGKKHYPCIIKCDSLCQPLINAC